MANTELETPMDYEVVVNDEGQYSIWMSIKPIPPGWSKVGVSGDKESCLDHIAAAWTDMRPVSLRKHMDENQSIEKPEARN